MDLNTLINFCEIKLKEYNSKKLKIFASSSFQTHSIPMLHMISQIDNTIPVYFLNTSFHFPETLEYRNQIAELLNIQVIDVVSPVPKIGQISPENTFYYATNTNHCCFLNKTLPMEPLMAEYDVWITGVRKDQNQNRKAFDYEAPGPKGIIRFHPMLDWTSKHIWEYTNKYKIPAHPLEAQGYLSIGCEPCTQKYIDLADSTNRSGRWKGQKKTECGLHTDLIEKK